MIETDRDQNALNKRLLSIKELVSEVGATEWFWRSQIWNGKLSYVKTGHKIFVDRKDIELFITNNKHKN